MVNLLARKDDKSWIWNCIIMYLLEITERNEVQFFEAVENTKVTLECRSKQQFWEHLNEVILVERQPISQIAEKKKRLGFKSLQKVNQIFCVLFVAKCDLLNWSTMCKLWTKIFVFLWAKMLQTPLCVQHMWYQCNKSM